jgi:hypothetical protein
MTRQNAPASLRSLLFAAGLILQLAAPPVHAQDPAPYTLHVYTNLIQIPTLAVTEDLKQLPPIPLKDFNISLDSGPTFHPSRIHREGDDPIDLAILLDASGDQNILLQNFGNALATLTPGYLHPQDHVSIYAVDCALVRSFDDVPADSGKFPLGVKYALTAPALHGTKTKAACANHLRLWDAIVRISLDLSNSPDRRVLLVVSDGKDMQSDSKWADAMQALSTQSIALFAFQDTYQFGKSYTVSPSSGGRRSNLLATEQNSPEDLFRELCVSNGGTILPTPQASLAQNLQKLITLLRNRYILEFPRAEKSEPGLHNIDVTVPNPTAFIAITGVLVPMPDAKVLADPTTVPTVTPSQATYGNRRPLNPANEPHP